MMIEPHRVSASMVVEVLMRGWQKLPDEEKVALVRESDFRTIRKFGRPKGKSTADWDSSLK